MPSFSSLIENSIELDLTKRPRRNRKSPAIRGLIQETHLYASQLVAPLFLLEGERRRQAIAAMPGIERLSIDYTLHEVEQLLEAGVRTVDIFCYIPGEKKDPFGSEAFRRGNLLQEGITALKRVFPELCVMADIALDPYTTHGHDGLLNENGRVDNDSSVEALARMSLLAAEAGVDVVAPSDMMDGRIGYIRRALDSQGYRDVSILSYAVKFVSAFYGPFREALDSAPKIGTKEDYQVNPANRREALLECALDEEEGADMLLIKPALPYLDVIAKVREQTCLPLGAYHVSGEYAMLMAAAEKGWIDGDKALAESLLSIKRAGADFILTYGAKRMARILKDGI